MSWENKLDLLKLVSIPTELLLTNHFPLDFDVGSFTSVLAPVPEAQMPWGFYKK